MMQYIIYMHIKCLFYIIGNNYFRKETKYEYSR